MSQSLSDAHRATLRAVCDTVVPAIAREPDPDGFWARRATDVGADPASPSCSRPLPPDQLGGPRRSCSTRSTTQGFGARRRSSRASRSCATSRCSAPRPPPASRALIGLTLFLAYGAPDPQTGPEPELGDVRLPRARSPPPPDAPKPIAPLVPEGDERRSRPTSCVVGSGAGGGVIAGDAGRGGPRRRRARGRRLLQRVRLQPARAPGLPEDVLARRPDADGRRQRLAAGRHRRSAAARRSTGPTACAPSPGCASSGRASTASRASTAPTSTATSTRSGAARRHRRTASDLNGPHAADAGGRRARWAGRFTTDHPQRRPRALHARDRRLHRLRRPVRLASSRPTQDLAARRRPTRGARDRRRTAAPSGCWSRTAARPASRRTCIDPETARTAAVTVRAPQRRRRLRLARVAGAAAALADRRPGGRQLPAPAPVHRASSASTPRTSRPWWGAPQAGARRRVRRHRRRLRLPDRGRAVHDRADRRSAIAVDVGARAHKERDGAASRHGGDLHRPHARPRPRPRRRSTRDGEAVPYVLAHRRGRHRATRQRGIEAQVRLHEAAGAHEISPLAAGAADAGAAATTSRRSSRARSAIPLRAGGHRLFSAHQMGTLPHGHRPGDVGRRPVGRAARHARASGSATRSAFPTASGTNPMITIMALAHRTAEAIAGAAPAPRRRDSRQPRRRGNEAPDRSRSATPPSRSSATSSTSAASGSSPTARDDDRGRSTRPPRRSSGAIPEGTRRGRRPRGRAPRAPAFEAWSQTPLEERAELPARRSPPGSASAREEIAATDRRTSSGMPLELSRA